MARVADQSKNARQYISLHQEDLNNPLKTEKIYLNVFKI